MNTDLEARRLYLWLLSLDRKQLTAGRIRSCYEEVHGGKGHFFDRGTMKFFGDSMANLRAYVSDCGQIILARRRPVRYGGTGEWLVTPEMRLVSC